MRVQGKIIKGIGGFYYVHANEDVYECRAKGILRNLKIKPLIGDNVEMDILDEKDKLGNVATILPRKNQLIRPTVANISQVIITFAVANPEPNYNLLDRFLVMVEKKGIDAVICFNKSDQLNKSSLDEIVSKYIGTGYPIFLTSTFENEGIKALKEILINKTSVFAGPSGVGKSSLLNCIQEEVTFEIGEISEKIKRGKHTTRHAELICYAKDSYVVDTPGFSSLNIDNIDKDELKDYFVEFKERENGCRFSGCNHLSEPDCAIKEALNLGEISETRYKSYKELYKELKDLRRKW